MFQITDLVNVNGFSEIPFEILNSQTIELPKYNPQLNIFYRSMMVWSFMLDGSCVAT